MVANGSLDEYVSATLLELGVRPWQISQTGAELATTLLATEPLVTAPDPEQEAGEVENV
jgi:hypothetical protein